MYTRRQVCDRLAIHGQELDRHLDEYPSLFRSDSTFDATELKFLDIIRTARRDGIDDHHGVWVRLSLFIRHRPGIARRLAGRSVESERYLQAVGSSMARRNPLVSEITNNVMAAIAQDAARQQDEEPFEKVA